MDETRSTYSGNGGGVVQTFWNRVIDIAERRRQGICGDFDSTESHLACPITITEERVQLRTRPGCVQFPCNNVGSREECSRLGKLSFVFGEKASYIRNLYGGCCIRITCFRMQQVTRFIRENGYNTFYSFLAGALSFSH